MSVDPKLVEAVYRAVMPKVAASIQEVAKQQLAQLRSEIVEKLKHAAAVAAKDEAKRALAMLAVGLDNQITAIVEVTLQELRERQIQDMSRGSVEWEEAPQ